MKTGQLEELLSPGEVGLPNGMAWDTERRTMYFVDTYSGTITAYATDEAGVPVKGTDGKLIARLVAKVPKEEGIPDGMTIDRWVAGTFSDAVEFAQLFHMGVLMIAENCVCVSKLCCRE